MIVLPVKNAATHAMLREWLKEFDPAVRGEALDALARIGDPADAEVVRARLDDLDARVRAEALRAMARRGESPGEEALERLLADPEAIARHAAFAWGPAEAFRRRPDWVERGTGDPAPEVRAAAAAHAAALRLAPAEAVRRLKIEPDAAVRSAWLRGVAEGGDETREAVLRAALTSSDRPLVQTALETVGPGDAAVGGEVLGLAIVERGAVAAAAVAAAARARPPGAAVALARRLETETDPALRPPIAEALGALDGADAAAALAAELLRRRGFATQAAAARALGRMKAPGAGAALAAATDDPDSRVRALVAEILGARGEATAAGALWRMLDDAEPSVLAAALEALHRLGAPRAGARSERVRALTDHADPYVVAGAIRVRGDLGDRGMIPDLAQRLRHVRVDIPAEPRAAALDALAALGHGGEVRRAIELVAKNVVPPSPYSPDPMPDAPSVRRAALRYLERFGDAAAAETLLTTFDELPPPDLREEIARVATKLTGRPHRALPDYRFVTYGVESLDPPSHRAVPDKPGVVAETAR